VGLLDLVLPERCAACGLDGTSFCGGCLKLLLAIREPVCGRCGAPVAWPVERCAECVGRRLAFAQARAAVAYEGVAIELVRAWKEGGRRRFARLAARLVAGAVPAPIADVLTFVPAVHDRELWRGHNPARGLAEELGRLWHLPVRPLIVRASSNARRQRGLRRAERGANVSGAFVGAAGLPARVVLVDDVYTTGATAAVAAGALRSAGAHRVEVVTLARTLRHRGSGRRS
jgi:predicted amidophosphoribosyltransferase